ncbi:MAG: tripartite tricarboxylate transporter substrate-binding protein [Xanthobacteraceae bacterium]
MLGRWLTGLSVLLCASAGALAQSPADSWPSRTVRVIVPIAAGSGIDIVARAVSQQLAKQLGRPFVIENRPGAATTTGAAAVAGAAPDGYTILFHSVALTVTPSTMANLPYEVTRDLAGIMPITNTPLLLVTPPGKFKSVGDLVAEAKAENGTMNYATPGYGAAAHFTTERFRLSAGFEAQQIPFRGTVEAVTEVVAGRVAFYFAPLTTVQSLNQEGRLDALATTSKKRVSTLPNVPTTIEAGYPDSDFDFWVGMFVPAKTPRDVVDKLYTESRRAAELPELRAQLAAIGGEPMEAMTPGEFDDYVRKEIARNAAIAKAAGIKPK